MEGASFKEKESAYPLKVSKMKFATNVLYLLSFSICNLLGEKVFG